MVDKKTHEANMERVRIKQKECNFRSVNLCQSCRWFNYDYLEDLGYQEWCENPDNEDIEANEGEQCYFNE